MKRMKDIFGRPMTVQAIDKEAKVLSENAPVYLEKGKHITIINGEKRTIITKIYDYSNVAMVE